MREGGEGGRRGGGGEGGRGGGDGEGGSDREDSFAGRPENRSLFQYRISSPIILQVPITRRHRECYRACNVLWFPGARHAIIAICFCNARSATRLNVCSPFSFRWLVAVTLLHHGRRDSRVLAAPSPTALSCSPSSRYTVVTLSHVLFRRPIPSHPQYTTISGWSSAFKYLTLPP